MQFYECISDILSWKKLEAFHLWTILLYRFFVNVILSSIFGVIHIGKITQDRFDPLSVNNLPHSKKKQSPLGFICYLWRDWKTQRSLLFSLQRRLWLYALLRCLWAPVLDLQWFTENLLWVHFVPVSRLPHFPSAASKLAATALKGKASSWDYNSNPSYVLYYHYFPNTLWI